MKVEFIAGQPFVNMNSKTIPLVALIHERSEATRRHSIDRQRLVQELAEIRHDLVNALVFGEDAVEHRESIKEVTSAIRRIDDDVDNASKVMEKALALFIEARAGQVHSEHSALLREFDRNITNQIRKCQP